MLNPLKLLINLALLIVMGLFLYAFVDAMSSFDTDTIRRALPEIPELPLPPTGN